MNLADCMDALGAACATVDGLRAHPYYAGSVVPPAAVVAWPDSYEFDQAMQRGADMITLPVTVIVGRADARSSRDRLAQYCAGSGSDSIKAAVEAYSTTAWDSARVTKVEFGAVTIASITYLSAEFSVEAIGNGA